MKTLGNDTATHIEKDVLGCIREMHHYDALDPETAGYIADLQFDWDAAGNTTRWEDLTGGMHTTRRW